MGKEYEQTLLKRRHLCGQKYEKSSLSLVIREMQIKTILRNHLTPVRMAIIKKSGNNRYCRGCGDTGKLLHCWWEYTFVPPLWKTVWQFLKDLELEMPFEHSHYWVYTQRIISNSIIKTHAHTFIAALFTIAKTWKQLKCPLVIKLDKEMRHKCTMEYYAAVKTMSSCHLQGHG